MPNYFANQCALHEGISARVVKYQHPRTVVSANGLLNTTPEATVQGLLGDIQR
jgi:hypothetical protein